MNYMEVYQQWLEVADEKTKAELESIRDDRSEIEDRFYQSLEFGTAGLRGKLGAGTNRMNFYMIGKATQGIANYIRSKGQSYMERGVAIAHDCRHFSDEFAAYVAEIMAANGIKAFLFESLRPTPELSFTIRELNTASGVIITASHNPKEYNGYKVYWEDGAQVLSHIANGMTEEINRVDMFDSVKRLPLNQAIEAGLVTILGEEMDSKYLEKVKDLSIYDDENVDKSVSVVYTPLNGAGSVLVQRVLRERGFEGIHVVPEQEMPDPDFTTVGYPNPEDPKAFRYSENLGKKVGAELLIATDPDCDRLAIEVLDKKGEYIPLNGNQIGAILLKYIVEGLYQTGKLPKNPAMVKSIVTGDLGKAICESYGVTTFESLTGFKNICGRIPELTEKGYQYIFGYEESIGYATGTIVRDKDGVSSSMLLCEAAGYYKKQGKNLLDILKDIYEKYGFYKEKQISIILEGIDGQRRFGRIMEHYRSNYLTEFGSKKVAKVIDYLNGYEDIPSSNVLKFILDDGSWYALRPSGTEPKIKIYIYTKAPTDLEARQNVELIERLVLEKIDTIE